MHLAIADLHPNRRRTPSPRHRARDVSRQSTTPAHARVRRIRSAQPSRQPRVPSPRCAMIPSGRRFASLSLPMASRTAQLESTCVLVGRAMIVPRRQRRARLRYSITGKIVVAWLRDAVISLRIFSLHRRVLCLLSFHVSLCYQLANLSALFDGRKL